jgi:hypothetical protein
MHEGGPAFQNVRTKNEGETTADFSLTWRRGARQHWPSENLQGTSSFSFCDPVDSGDKMVKITTPILYGIRA